MIRTSRGPAAALAVLVGVHGLGCSYIAVDAPPRHPPRGHVDCHVEHWAPTADLAMFALLMIVNPLLVFVIDDEDPEPATAAAIALPFTTSLALFGASGFHGKHQLRRCYRLNGLAQPKDD